MFLVGRKQGGNFGEVDLSPMLVPLHSFFISSELEIWQEGM